MLELAVFRAVIRLKITVYNSDSSHVLSYLKEDRTLIVRIVKTE